MSRVAGMSSTLLTNATWPLRNSPQRTTSSLAVPKNRQGCSFPLTPATKSSRASSSRTKLFSATANAAPSPAASPAASVEAPSTSPETPVTPAPSSSFRPGEKKGFVEEMRIRAMKLHTRSQAKEGEQQETEKPLAKWEPSKEGYIQFLTDSKYLFQTMEDLMQEAAHPSYKEFVNTGLERTKALAQDLAWFQEQGCVLPEPGQSGTEYADYLRDLARTNPPAFICHFYNVYFAHSAGGKMIGKKVADSILGGAELEFYKWEGDLKELLQNVRDKLNLVAESWTRDEKDVCLEETTKSFKLSGAILRSIFS